MADISFPAARHLRLRRQPVCANAPEPTNRASPDVPFMVMPCTLCSQPATWSVSDYWSPWKGVPESRLGFCDWHHEALLEALSWKPALLVITPLPHEP